MNLEELRSVRNTERQKDSLQELRPSFYREVGEYIGTLEDERDEVAATQDDPFASPEVARLTDEIEAAKDVAEAIYERRMGKLVKQASLAAAGMTADSEGLTSEEAALFEDLVDRIGTNKSEILSVLEGRTDGVTDERTDRTETDTSGEPTDPAPATQDAPESTAEAPPTPPSDEPPVDPESSERGEGDSFDVTDAMGSSTATETTTATDEQASDESPPPDGPSASDDESGTSEGSASDDPAGESSTDGDEAVERVTVQITADVGSILGVDDREYTLASDDVVTLPEANADPLIERDAAKPLE